MDENPSGAQPAEPAAPVTEPAAPVTEPAAPAEEPVAPAAEPAAPAESTMEAAPAANTMPVTETVSSEKPKKKTGLIVGICALIALVCGGVAVALLYPFGGGNGGRGPAGRVKEAILALFDEGASDYVVMEGTITLTANTEDSSLSDALITFKSNADTKSMANSAEATISLSLASGTNLSIDLDEIYTKDGDFYLRLNNLTDLIEDYPVDVDTDLVDCDDDSGMTDCVEETDSTREFIYALDALGIIDMIDGEWVKISFDGLADMFDLEIDTSPVECVKDVLSDADELRKGLAANYETNPFVLDSTENLGITKKKNDLYRLSIDTDALNNFSTALESSDYAKGLNDCLGESTSGSDSKISSSTLAKLPVTYVEVDSNKKFTRLYMESSSDDNSYSIKADIDLSYPTSVTITEPDDYVELQEIIMKLYSGF